MTDTTTSSHRRHDGRQPTELRGRELKVSVSPTTFDGSCFYTQGNTALTVSVHGPTAASRRILMEDGNGVGVGGGGGSAGAFAKAATRIRVLHADSIPPAGGAERTNQLERRVVQQSQLDSSELLSLLEPLVRAVFIADRYPRDVLCIDVCILSADGSLAAAAVNAVMAALLDAGVPCRTTMAAVSVAAMTRHASSTNTPTTDGANKGGKKRARGDGNGKHDADGCGDDDDDGSALYLLDPTTAEEEASFFSSSSDSSLSLSSPSSEANIVRMRKSGGLRCTGLGVFVFSNPSCGGGLLASRVYSRSGSNNSDTDSSERSVNRAQWLAMAALTERASAVVFSFFRLCNVPME